MHLGEWKWLSAHLVLKVVDGEGRLLLYKRALSAPLRASANRTQFLSKYYFIWVCKVYLPGLM